MSRTFDPQFIATVSNPILPPAWLKLFAQLKRIEWEKILIVALSVLVVWAAWSTQAHREAASILWYSPMSRVLLIFAGIYGTASVYWTFWRLYLAIRYRAFAKVARDKLPSITIVVPAFNEGRLVGETIRRLAQADYPRKRMEIIVVDDGSDDDTWSHIQAAADEIGPLVRTIRCQVNRGKRWALWEGFRRGKGDIFVTVDSDSIIEPDALHALVSPMVSDKNMGGVAGNVTVLNIDGGHIPRMLGVRYVMTFDYKRAAQSMMGGGSVLCCAGALAAYRRKAVMPVLDQWLHQTFRGMPARAGEDHAMTNFILSQGFKVCYQRSARVLTKSPTTYGGLCKMFLRWARSNIRESLHTGRWVFTNFSDRRKWDVRFNFVMCFVGLFLPYFFLVPALLLSLFLPQIFGLKLLASCVTASTFNAAFYAAMKRNTEAVYGVIYGFYATFMIWWVWPYALLTCQKSVWMTRKLAVPPPRPTLHGPLDGALLLAS